MLKAYSRLFEHLTLATDLLLIASCWVFAYLIRFHLKGNPAFLKLRKALEGF